MTEELGDDQTDFEEAFQPEWGANAPRGGKAVLNRVLKDGNKVPLFLGQTFVNSLRDVGYNNTTSALCEHVDNAIQASANEVRVYFTQAGQAGAYEVDALVYDDGDGMEPHVLQVAMSFGGSMHFDNRDGIGRFGVGMKTAALSMAPAFDVYTWTERGAIHSMTLDVDEISTKMANLLELPTPEQLDAFPTAVARVLTEPTSYPRAHAEQDLVSESEDSLLDDLPSSGTIVYIPDCDRLTYKKAQTLAQDAMREMARVYRVQIAEGLRLYVNNKLVEAFDPTYWDPSARHTKADGLNIKRSSLVKSWTEIQVPISEDSAETAPLAVRLYKLPIEDWYDLPRKVLKNDLRVFDKHTVSFMRNDREVFSGVIRDLVGAGHGDLDWLRLQIDFDGRLDEALGVAMNKQGVRPKKYALEIIKSQIKEEVSRLRKNSAQYRKESRAKASGTRISEAERRAGDADPMQAKPLPSPAPNTPEEEKELESNLRTLAVGLKRENESDEDAFKRIVDSKYVTTFKHDPYWPFYHVEFRYGKIILTINTAHPFFGRLYDPIQQIALDDDDDNGNDASEILVSLQMLLFSLGRTQSQMDMAGENEERAKLFEDLRREWSENLKTQLLAD